MHSYEASSTISATPSDVWRVLVDGASWALWDSGVDAVEGQIAAGRKITIRSQAAPGRSFPVKVTAFEPAARLEFTGGCRSACSKAYAPTPWLRGREQ